MGRWQCCSLLEKGAFGAGGQCNFLKSMSEGFWDRTGLLSSCLLAWFSAEKPDVAMQAGYKTMQLHVLVAPVQYLDDLESGYSPAYRLSQPIIKVQHNCCCVGPVALVDPCCPVSTLPCDLFRSIHIRITHQVTALGPVPVASAIVLRTHCASSPGCAPATEPAAHQQLQSWHPQPS